MGKDKQVKQHSYLATLYLQYIQAKDCHVKLDGKSAYLHGRHVIKFLTDSWVLAYQ